MSQSKHSDALVLVYDGATMLLKHDQVTFTFKMPTWQFFIESISWHTSM
jgi:hypothetical protein